jgi:hypothetical protein
MERAHIAEPGETPGRIVASDECGHRRPHLGGRVEDTTVDDLLLERAERTVRPRRWFPADAGRNGGAMP